MDRDTIFLYVIAVIALCFGLINCIQFFLKGNKTAETVGTIISFKTINPENSKFRNSKWRPFRIKWMEERISPKTAYKYQWRHRLEQPLPCVMTRKIRKNCIVFLFYELLYHLSWLPSALQWLYSILYKIRRIEIMPHFPGWFVAICVLLPISNVIQNMEEQ